jgi:hypothetical protein
MSKPIDFLIENQARILEVYKNNDGKPKKTWNSLCVSLPELSKTMTYSTFKQYLSVFVALSAGLKFRRENELSNVRQKDDDWPQEQSTFKQALTEMDKEIKSDKSELSKLSLKVHRMAMDVFELQSKMKMLETKIEEPGRQSRNIDGWTVRLTAKGYYHLCKSFGGKVKTIYIGKVLDEEKAKQKIADYMSTIE